MSVKVFKFKQFDVAHDRCSHKIGADGVLLGCWAEVKQSDRFILDIGTGSGLIALILAQRSHPEAHIDAVEIRNEDAAQARENVLRSPWPEKITIHHMPVQSFSGKHYDLIVTNPPFFRNSLLPPDPGRITARHANELPFTDLVEVVVRSMSPEGRFALILPPNEASQLTSLCERRGLYPTRQTAFHSRQHKPAERILLQLSTTRTTQDIDRITLHDMGNTWSHEYRALTNEFYVEDKDDRS